MMRFIGITGGVGAGKSTVIDELKKRPGVCVLLADDIARGLMKPGGICYDSLRERFEAEPVWQPDGRLDSKACAAVIFSDEEKRNDLNAIVHPVVRAYVQGRRDAERHKDELSYLFLEAALLVEEHYEEVCDELWYVHASQETRRARLRASRGYSDARIDAMFASQLSEEEYRAHCQVVIENDGDFAETVKRIDEALRREKQNG